MHRWSLVLLALLSTAPVSAANVVWVEAELFDQPGGWINDSQFVDQMGSPFLLAIGLEGPVADAVTTVDVPATGKYRLLVRSRDWTPEHSPGRFQVLVNGVAAEKTFGQNKNPKWVWEDGGTHELKAGKAELRLRDLSGHYGRCDALVLVDDAGFQPPDDLKALGAARIAHGGVSREVKTLPSYDTVVVGGGLAGTFAAVASARMGCKTALLQDRPVLGGNGSTEVLVRPEGDTTREPLEPGEGGIIEEVRGSGEGYSERMLKLCRAQKNLDLYLNTHATGVRMKSKDTIAAVEALDVVTKQRLLVPGTIFVDCTGDGAIGVWAGAEWRHGREPRSMYNESRAPEVGDGHTMGGTLRYATERLPQDVAFKPVPWARKFDECGDFNRDRHPKLTFGGWQWVIEYGGMSNTYTDAEEIRDELLRIIWGMWDHAKNHCPQLAAEANKYKLTWVSHVVGKRESRRLIGDYVMTEHDIAAKKLFPDRVSYAGWGIDIHPPGGFYDKEPPAVFSHKVKFSIPLRSLYSKDIGNLLMAGRNISVSHVALGATRVMITCGLQGQAAGTAAGFCKMHRVGPRGVYQNYITDLQQQLLKDGCYLIDLPNQDPRDLALQAKAVAASSQSPGVKLDWESDLVHKLTTSRAVMFKFDGQRIDTLALYLYSDSRQPIEVKLGLRPAKAIDDYSAKTDVATATATVSKRGRGWVTFKLNAALKPGFYYAYLPKTAGLAWGLYEMAPPNTGRAWLSGKDWTSSEQAYIFHINPKPEDLKEQPNAAQRQVAAEEMFAPNNVIDGYARAIRGHPHSWRPDPQAKGPQWVELDFGKPVAFNAVYVTFQAKWMRAEEFRLEVPDGDGWKPVAQVTENFERRAKASFPAVTASKLRLVIEKARPEMGVCEIRIYDERP